MSDYLVALLKAAAKTFDEEAQDKAGLFEYRKAFQAALFGSANYYGDRIQDRVPKALRALMLDSATCKLIRAALPDWTTYRRKWIRAINESDSGFPLDLADDDMREAPSPEQAAILLYLAAGRVQVANMEKVFVAPFDWPGLCLEEDFSLGKSKILSAGLLFRTYFDGLAKSKPQNLAEALASAFRWVAEALPAPVAQADGKEQPWADDVPEYLPLTEARKLIDNRFSLPTLSKLMTPDGEMRYMRKEGCGCKVHLGDLRRYMQGRQSDPKWAAAYMNWLQGQKAGKTRLFWKCGKCSLEYPDEARATDRCPQCKSQSALTLKAPPKPSK
jgi:hypothetical protein